MVALRDQIEPGEYHHPITMPLANVGWGSIVNRYGPTASFDFWSIQVYQPNLTDVFTIYTEALEAANSTRRNTLPILFTEFGVDYLQDDQIDRLLGMWSDITAMEGVLSLGGCIMEVCQEIY
jgi:hypothetical protein